MFECSTLRKSGSVRNPSQGSRLCLVRQIALAPLIISLGFIEDDCLNQCTRLEYDFLEKLEIFCTFINTF